MLIQLQPGWVFVRLWPSFELSSPIQASLRILFVRKSKHDLWFEIILIICSLSYVATDAVLSWKWKLFPYDIICLLKWKLKRWIVKRGKTIKKISHPSSTKFIPQCLTKFLLLGDSGLEAWKRMSTPSDSPNKLLFYIFSVISTFISFQCSLGYPLGTSSFSALCGVPWAYLVSATENM